MYPKNIIGILDCKSKTIFGINKKTNTPLVVFKPHNPEIPNFLIPSKLKYTNKNYYCIITPSNKDSKYRFPIGSLKYTIGEVADFKSHCEYLLHIHGLNHKEPKISKKQIRKLKKSDGNIWKIIKKTDLKNYIDKTNLNTITIDPKDSKDFDDAISLNGDLIGIHIADVTFWLEKLNISPDFFSTVYLPHRKINMIPTILADNICSLQEGFDRLALTLWYNIKTNEYHFENNIINVNKNYTYEEYSTKTPLYLISKHIGQKYNMDMEKWDTHKMIEAFMILANNKTAEYLKAHNKPLFRSHNQKFHNYDLSKIKNEEFLNFMKIYLSNSAEYTPENNKHYGLNLDLYTHFTSPIRRMADCLVHYIIKNNDVNIDYNKLNEDTKKTRILQRDIEKSNIISKLTRPIELTGYVVRFEKDIITCYFPQIKLCDNFPLIPRRLNDVITEEEREQQRGKIKIFADLKVYIAKKGQKLVFSF